MTTMYVQVDPGTRDAGESDRLTRLFYAELALLDIDVIDRNDDHFVPGAKGGSGLIGTIILAVANSATAASVCRLAVAWVARDHPRTIRISAGERTLEITGANRQQQQQAIDAFLDGLLADSKNESVEHQ